MAMMGLRFDWKELSITDKYEMLEKKYLQLQEENNLIKKAYRELQFRMDGLEK